jgi:glycogen debranching enzyme
VATIQALQTPMGVMASGKDDLFHALFGRDSLWTILLALEAGRRLPTPNVQEEGNTKDSSLLQPEVYREWLFGLCKDVLCGLGSLQGRVINDINEEQPGRVVHEHWDPVPPGMQEAGWPVINGSYYGAFDATMLYLIAAAHVDDFFDDRRLLESLWPHIHAALLWMLDWSDLDEDGLVEYQLRNPHGIGLRNQVWKDSGESIRAPEGEKLYHPLAWIEVQGYALEAYTSYLALAQKLGRLDPELRAKIEPRLEGLRKGLTRFWLADEAFPAIALDGQKQPIEAVASNPGHLLWARAVNVQQAEQICKRLMQPDMFTPWGIRTLSEKAYFYDPFKYQVGTVWPFDNAVIALGMEHYGFKHEACELARTVLEAVQLSGGPVELYMVLHDYMIRSPRIDQKLALVEYHYASSVQTWTAATILYLITLFLNE